ncbi:LysR family transcriptional regulator, partial [Escherichia coli]
MVVVSYRRLQQDQQAGGNMDVLHAMRAFVRVVDAGSFTAAANALGLSTAQVSRVVSDLESQLEA